MSRSLTKRAAALLLVVCLLAASATALSACRGEDEPPAPTPAEPGGNGSGTDESETPPVPEDTRMDVAVYLMNGEDVAHVTRNVPKTEAVLKASLEQLFQGPNAQERAKGLGTEIPPDTRLIAASVVDGVANIDVTGPFDDGGGTLSMTARMAQLVYTATQFPSVDSVRLFMHGTPVEALGGEGIIIDEPQTRADYEEVTPAILVDGPGWFSTCSSPLPIRGTANVFEASFLLEVYDGANTKVFERIMTATSGTGTRGTWSVTATFTGAAPGSGTIRVFSYSPQDGSVVNETRVPVTIR